jgi:hypothetical protein
VGNRAAALPPGLKLGAAAGMPGRLPTDSGEVIVFGTAGEPTGPCDAALELCAAALELCAAALVDGFAVGFFAGALVDGFAAGFFAAAFVVDGGAVIATVADASGTFAR